MAKLRMTGPVTKLTYIPTSTPTSTPSIPEIYQLFVAQQGETLLYVTAAFTPGDHQLNVYRNGVYQYEAIHYVEVDNHTVKFLKGLDADDSILITSRGVYSLGGFSADQVQILHEEYIANPNQLVFPLYSSYHPGYKTLRVHVNGVLQSIETDYDETDTYTVTFRRPMTGTERIIFHEQV